MKKEKIINVILSGGSGTRLWPLSRTSKPKQFLKIFDGFSLFQHTVIRNKTLVDDFLLVTNQIQLKEGISQLKQLNYLSSNNVIEPVGRNTAPAIALAALNLEPNDIMIVTPSDHMIKDMELYSLSIKRAINLAKEGFLVTFGIKPVNPNTGFGYIEYDEEEVLSFREKPDLKTAEEFIKAGNFNWNSGIFCFKASVFIEELKRYNNIMYESVLEAHRKSKKGLIDKELMLKIPSDSIDYAVLEKSKKIKTVATSFYWTDLGTFDAIVDYFDEGSSVVGLKKQNDLSTYSFSRKKVFTNIDNLIIIDQEDCIVVLERNKSNDIKELYNRVKNEDSGLTE